MVSFSWPEIGGSATCACPETCALLVTCACSLWTLISGYVTACCGNVCCGNACCVTADCGTAYHGYVTAVWTLPADRCETSASHPDSYYRETGEAELEVSLTLLHRCYAHACQESQNTS